MNVEHEVEVLKRQVRSLRDQVRKNEDWPDVVSSSLCKRLWWVCQGYRFHRVGRWYAKTKELR